MWDSISEASIINGRAALMDGWGGRPGIIITRGRGALVWDDSGKEYIDCTAQAYSLNVGASHPRVLEAISKQCNRISHVQVAYDSIPLLLLSEKLASIAPGNLKRVSYCLEGAVACEGALKLAAKNRPKGKNFISLWDGYHGRTILSMSVSWPHTNLSFVNQLSNVVRIPAAYCYRCPFNLSYPSCNIYCAEFAEETMKRAVDGPPIALIMEPIQGNGGIVEFPKEFYRKIRDVCTRQNVMLIFDEIQTAFGRIGEKMFAADVYDVVPDIIAFGKSVAGGFPLAGILASDDVIPFDPGDHAFTFGHFTASMAAALATIAVIEEEGLLQRCTEVGDYILDALRDMQKKHELIGDVRGRGLMIAAELVRDRETKEPAVEETTQILSRGLEEGVIFGGGKYGGLGNVIKIKPPIVISDSEIETVLKVFEKCLVEAAKR